MKHYVTGFMFSADLNQLALIEKRQPEWQAGLLNGIGGKIEENESAVAAMVREFEEETSVQTTNQDWTLFAIIERPGHYIVHFFCAFTDAVFDVTTVEQERVLIVDSKSLPGNVIFNLNWLIPMAMDQELVFENPVTIQEVKRSK